jgi:hypothetical protein
MPQKDALTLLKKLKVPTFLDPPASPTKFVDSFADFFVSIEYTDSEYSSFVTTLLQSVNDADVSEYPTDEEKEDALEGISDSLHDMLITLQEKRSRKNRFFNLPSRRDIIKEASVSQRSTDIAVDESLERRFKDAHTMIGPIALDPEIPVVEVEITENYSAQTTRTLRSNTDPVFKSHKSDIMMAITIEVPSNRINDRGPGKPGLLTLLATLKAFPVCEIVSSAITPVFLNSILAPELFENLRQQVAEEIKLKTGASQKRQSEQIQTLKSDSFGTNLDNFKKFIGNLNPVIDYMIRDEENSKENLEKQDPVFSSVSKLRNVKGSLTVPCAYTGCIVKTSPGKTNQLSVKLFFRRFNDKIWNPYGKIIYRDVNGKPTPNVTECPWIERIALMMFTNNVDNPTNFMEPYRHRLSEEESGMTFEWVQPTQESNSKFTPHGKDWVIQDIEARSFMKTAQLPLLGSPYPTVQYMGIDNVHARVSVVVKSGVELARFHEMKASLDRLNYEAGPNSLRHHYVRIKNNLLNFLGARDFVITGITTHRQSEEEVWNVEFELLESSVSANEAEAIVIKDNAFKEKADIKKIWDHIFNLLSEQTTFPWEAVSNQEKEDLTSPTSAFVSRFFTGYKDFPKDANNIKPYELDSEAQMAWRLVFERAGDRGSGSILQPNIMAAAWYSLAMKSRAKEDSKSGFFPWNTGFRNEPRIAAVMEGRQFEQSTSDNLLSLFSSGRQTDINRGDKGFFTSWAMVANAGMGHRTEHFFITGKYNPASIFEFSPLSGAPGNRIRETSEDQIYETWPNLTNAERRAQKQAADWLSKGQYDSDSDTFAETLDWFGNESQFNIFEQGKELLEWMAMGEGRHTVFFSKEFWDEYFNILFEQKVRPDADQNPAWNNTDIVDARWKLTSLLREGGYLDFPSLTRTQKLDTLQEESRFVRTNLDDSDIDKREQTRGKYEAYRSNYADMRLPSYGKVFRNDKTNELLTNSDGKLTWREFAPTFSDLGIKPAYHRQVVFESTEQAINKIARKENDPIEPDAVYFHFRLKGQSLAKHLASEENINNHLTEINKPRKIVVPNKTARGGSFTVDQYLKEVWKVPNERYLMEAFDKQTDHDSLRALQSDGKIKSIVVIDEEGNPLGNVLADSQSKSGIRFNPMKGIKFQVFSGDASTPVDPYSSEQITAAAKDIIIRSEDRTGSMSRIFPAYRLYFIEQDRGYRFLADDLYGVNCLISVSIRKDKNDADVMVATLSNTTDNLSNELVLSSQQADSLGLSADDQGEPYFSSLKLQSGINVQLRLGYGSNPDELPIVFTGMITEIEPGKIVEITAQGHKRELLNEVQFDMESINHFDIIRKILEKTEHPNLGEAMTASRYSSGALATRFAEGQNPNDFIGLTDTWYNKKVVDMSNIYLVSNAPLETSRKVYFDKDKPIVSTDPRVNFNSVGVVAERIYDFFDPARKAISEIRPDHYWIETAYSNGKWAKWVIPPQSAWDAIQEITRHRPGTIAQVVPYDSRGTLFVGQPEQAYQATDPNHAELLTYSMLQGSIGKKINIDFGNDVIRPFMDSIWGKMYLTHYKGNSLNFTGLAPRIGTTALAQPIDPRSLLRPLSELYTDSTIFIRPTDIMELDELPDSDDKSRINEYLYSNSSLQLHDKDDFTKEAEEAIRKALGEELPPGFNIPGMWWIYADDLTTQVRELNRIEPRLVESLFMWYYDLDPSATALQIPNINNSIKPLFFSSDSMGNFIEELLKNTGTELSANYKRLKNGSASLNAVQLRTGGEEDQINFLITQSLITEEEANALRKRLFSGQNNPMTRQQLHDPVLDIIDSADDDLTLAHLLAKTGGGFRLFIFNVYRFMVQSAFSGSNLKINEAIVRNSASKVHSVDLPPGKKIFRGYHYIGMADIIENNIEASMEEMSNCCLVRAPASEVAYEVIESDVEDDNGDNEKDIVVEFEETDWRSYPTTDGAPYTWKIGKENRKLGVVYELNAIHPNQKAKTLMSNMGLMISPMYRGSLLVVGRDIKPHDVVYICDTENDLRGHFEVESCTHHFSVGTGWITDIKPCALVRVNNPTAEIQLASTQSFLSDTQILLDVLDVGLTAFTIAGFFMTSGASGVVATSIRSGVKIGARVGQEALKKNMITRALKSSITGFTKRAFSDSVAGISSGVKATLSTAKLQGNNRALAFASYFGGILVPTRGLLTLGALQIGLGASDAATSLYVKHLLSSTELPIDVHYLLYRGQVLQAGLEIDDRDIYSLYDKITAVTKEMKRDVGEFFTGLADDFSGVQKNTSVLERARQSRDR